MDQKVSFIHFRNPDYINGGVSSKGGATIAYTQISEGVFKYAAALCHARDPFVKSYGRAKAAGRLNSPAYVQHIQAPNKEMFISYLQREYDVTID